MFVSLTSEPGVRIAEGPLTVPPESGPCRSTRSLRHGKPPARVWRSSSSPSPSPPDRRLPECGVTWSWKDRRWIRPGGDDLNAISAPFESPGTLRPGTSSDGRPWVKTGAGATATAAALPSCACRRLRVRGGGGGGGGGGWCWGGGGRNCAYIAIAHVPVADGRHWVKTGAGATATAAALPSCACRRLRVRMGFAWARSPIVTCTGRASKWVEWALPGQVSADEVDFRSPSQSPHPDCGMKRAFSVAIRFREPQNIRRRVGSRADRAGQITC